MPRYTSILFLSLLVSLVSIHSHAERQFAVELHGGISSLEPTSTFDSDTGAVPIGSDDDSAFAIRARYYLNDFFALEVGYQDYGEGQTITTNPNAGLPFDIENTFSASAFDLGIHATVDMGANIDFVARIGMSMWDYDFTARPLNGNDPTSINDSSNDLYLGVGAQYRLFDDFYIGVSITGLSVEVEIGDSEVGNDLEATTLHVGYDF